jgi:SNF2 family DNA or RNA helicase
MLQRNLVKEGHHVLIFSQTRKMLNLIQVRCCYLILLYFTLP